MTDHVFVLHVWDGTNDSEGTVRVYRTQSRAEMDARQELQGIDPEGVDWSIPEVLKLNGYTMHATYGPNDALVSVRKMVVR